MCHSLAAVKQTGNCVILANRFAFSSPLFPFSFSCSSPLAVTPTLFHQSPSTPLLPRCSMLPLPLQSESSNYALCHPLKINVYGGGRNGNVDPATTPAAVTTLCYLWNQVEREKYERKIERDVTEAFGWRVEKKNPFQMKQHGKQNQDFTNKWRRSSPRGLVDAENRRVLASSFVTGWRTGCDTSLLASTKVIFHTSSWGACPALHADTTQGRCVQETSGCLRLRGHAHCLFGCHGTTSTQLNFTHNPLTQDPSMGWGTRRALCNCLCVWAAEFLHCALSEVTNVSQTEKTKKNPKYSS